MPVHQPLDDAALDQLFRTARTYYGYLDKPVPTETLHALWELIKMGPTSANSLPARLLWVTTDEAKERLAKLASDNNQEKIRKAPVTVIVAQDNEFHQYLPEFFPHADAKSWFEGADKAGFRATTALRNSSLQGAYFILAARALGLDTGPMSGFDNAGVDAEFFADQPNVKSNFISTLGYGDTASLFPRSPRPDFGRFNSII